MFIVSSPYLVTFPYKIRSVAFWSISCTSLWSTTKTTGIFHQCSQLRGVGICLACQHHSNIHREEWFLADRKKILGTFQSFDPFFFFLVNWMIDDWCHDFWVDVKDDLLVFGGKVLVCHWFSRALELKKDVFMSPQAIVMNSVVLPFLRILGVQGHVLSVPQHSLLLGDSWNQLLLHHLAILRSWPFRMVRVVSDLQWWFQLGDGLNHLAVWQLNWTRPKGWYFSGAQDIIIYLEVHNHQLDQFLLESRLSKRETVGAEFFQNWIHIQRIGFKRELDKKAKLCKQTRTEEFTVINI